MKTLILFLTLFPITSCFGQNEVKQNTKEKYYFYFDKDHPKTKTFEKEGEFRYYYYVENDYPVIFTSVDSYIKKIKKSSLKNYDYKNFDWLNEFSNLERSRFFSRKAPISEFYVIEKRSSNEVLYIRKVHNIEEIAD